MTQVSAWSNSKTIGSGTAKERGFSIKVFNSFVEKRVENDAGDLKSPLKKGLASLCTNSVQFIARK